MLFKKKKLYTRTSKLILASLLVVFIFSYGVGVGRYDWFPLNEIRKTYYKLTRKDVIEKLSHNENQTLASSTNENQTLASSTNAMTFIAYGDNPYVLENDLENVISGLIDVVNRQNPALIVHIGDTFSGQPCTNSMLDLQYEMMNKFNAPVLYTPGDNEWRDCSDETIGATHNLERLDYIRKTYFSNQKTLGKISEFVETQRERGYPENRRLTKDNVAFITAHVVGSDNNFDPMSKQNTMEYFDRDAANIDWIKESFNKYENASAFVVAIHADMFTAKPYYAIKNPYKNFSNVLYQLSNKYEKPVLILFGDSHNFRTFKPSPKRYPFIYAIEVYGWPDLKAIKIEVDVSQKTPFRVIEIISYK